MEVKFSRDPSADEHPAFSKCADRLSLKLSSFDKKAYKMLRSFWEDGYGVGISECLGLHNKNLLFEGDKEDEEDGR